MAGRQSQTMTEETEGLRTSSRLTPESYQPALPKTSSCRTTIPRGPQSPQSPPLTFGGTARTQDIPSPNQISLESRVSTPQPNHHQPSTNPAADVALVHPPASLQEDCHGVLCQKTSADIELLLSSSRHLYVGKDPPISLPQAAIAEWEDGIKRRLMMDIRSISTDLIRTLKPDKILVLSELCMFGKRSRGSQALTLRPTIVIMCASKACRDAIRRGIEGLNYLRCFSGGVEVFSSALRFASPQWDTAERDFTVHSDEILHRFDADDAISACGLLLLGGRKPGKCFQISRIGGTVKVGDRYWGLTTAHGLVHTRGKEDTAESDSESYTDSNSSSDSAFETEQGQVISSTTAISRIKSLHRMSRSQRDASHRKHSSMEGLRHSIDVDNIFDGFGFKSHANLVEDDTTPVPKEPLLESADFALVALRSRKALRNIYQDPSTARILHITTHFRGPGLFHGKAYIVHSLVNVQSCYVLPSSSTMSCGMSMLSTQSIKLEQPLPRGSSGAWVVKDNISYGAIVALDNVRLYAYMIPMSKVLHDVCVACNLPVCIDAPPHSIGSGRTLPSPSKRPDPAPSQQIPVDNVPSFESNTLTAEALLDSLVASQFSFSSITPFGSGFQLVDDENAFWPYHAPKPVNRNYVGILHDDEGELVEAERKYNQGLIGYGATLKWDDTSILPTINLLGILRRRQDRLSEAEEIFTWALRGYEKVLGAGHTSTLATVNNLGIVYKRQGALEKAEKMYTRAVQGYEKALGPKDLSTLAVVNNLGVVFKDHGKLVEAEQMYARSLHGYEEILGPEHRSTLQTVGNLGVLYKVQGKLVMAEAMYARALRGFEKAYGRNHTSTLSTIGNLALLYVDQGKLAKAEAMYARALEGYEQALGRELMSSYLPALNTMLAFGDLYALTGRKSKAKFMYSHSLIGYGAVQGISSQRYADIEGRLKAL